RIRAEDPRLRNGEDVCRGARDGQEHRAQQPRDHDAAHGANAHDGHDRVKTKVEQELEDAAARHEDDPARANMLHLARRFKASWLELAEALTETKRKGAWKKW